MLLREKCIKPTCQPRIRLRQGADATRLERGAAFAKMRFYIRNVFTDRYLEKCETVSHFSRVQRYGKTTSLEYFPRCNKMGD
jgi:hypothetical protein